MQVSEAGTVDLAIKAAELILIPILWKIYQTLSDLSTKVSSQSTEISTLKTILIGTDGRNGIRSRVRRLERRQEQTALLLASLHGEGMKIEEEEEEE
jgi:hypothetical protein